jgi:hypothetical protein
VMSLTMSSRAWASLCVLTSSAMSSAHVEATTLMFPISAPMFERSSAFSMLLLYKRNNKNNIDIEDRIKLTRRTIYALLGPGLHARRGIKNIRMSCQLRLQLVPLQVNCMLRHLPLYRVVPEFVYIFFAEVSLIG